MPETMQTADIRKIKVRAGDSLYSIAKRELGDGDLWPQLFRMNRAIILREQERRHARSYSAQIGQSMFQPEDWIFPGMEIQIG